jgi:hypothetical protein
MAKIHIQRWGQAHDIRGRSSECIVKIQSRIYRTPGVKWYILSNTHRSFGCELLKWVLLMLGPGS